MRRRLKKDSRGKRDEIFCRLEIVLAFTLGRTLGLLPDCFRCEIALRFTLDPFRGIGHCEGTAPTSASREAGLEFVKLGVIAACALCNTAACGESCVPAACDISPTT